MDEPAGAGGGYLLELLTDSYSVRALLGSLVALVLAALAVRTDAITAPRARRVLVLAPVLVAAVAALSTARELSTVADASAAYLPQLFLTVPGALLDGPRLDVLLYGYLAVAGVLLARRLVAAVAVHRLLHRGRPADLALRRTAARLSNDLGLRRVPRVVLLPACPGGGFACGVLRPVIAVDPGLVGALDDREVEGLLAHELAHVRRRDPAVQLGVAVFRDLTFFLPTLGLPARWLRHEQEESADAAAARVTSRPGALASGIVKAFERGHTAAPRTACAAVPAGALRLAGPGSSVLPRRQSRERARIVRRRVERLLGDLGPISRQRRLLEMGIALTVLAAGTAAALAVPGWVAEAWVHSVGVEVIPPVAAEPAEPAVLSTFRDLAARSATSGVIAEEPVPGLDEECHPCVETGAQLRTGQAAMARDDVHGPVAGNGQEGRVELSPGIVLFGRS